MPHYAPKMTKMMVKIPHSQRPSGKALASGLAQLPALALAGKVLLLLLASFLKTSLVTISSCFLPLELPSYLLQSSFFLLAFLSSFLLVYSILH